MAVDVREYTFLYTRQSMPNEQHLVIGVIEARRCGIYIVNNYYYRRPSAVLISSDFGK